MQVLHYHLVVKATKRKFKKWLKHVTDHVTCLHKVYGYQKAVVVSETQAGNIINGKIGRAVTCLHKVYGYQKAVVVSETQAGNIINGKIGRA
ncbi:hypothetical protein CV717_28490, partial [Bacillus cereus]